MASAMITRHFDHPSGATATLEMPAGWSRNCWYELRATNSKGVANPVDRKTFSTPEEARQAAVVKEREALKMGWRPRMAATTGFPAGDGNPVDLGRLCDQTGQPIRCVILQIETKAGRSREIFSGGIPREGHEERTMCFILRMDQGESITVPQRILWRRKDNGKSIQAAIVTSKIDQQGNGDWHVYGAVRQQQSGDEEAWRKAEERADREAILQAGIETETSVTELWDWLGIRVTDASERAQVNAAILRGRAERQARLAQQEEFARQREESRQREEARQRATELQEEFARQREESRQREEARQRATELQVRRPLLLPKQPSENLRVPGVDLSKPKKRKIDLGE